MNSFVVDVADMSPQTRGHRQGEDSTLADRLRSRRKEIGWTQVQLAEKVGTSQAVIQKIENGKSLRPRILEEIAFALEVAPSWLMFGVEEAAELSGEALELARAWTNLPEPHRSAMRDTILRMRHARR